MIDSGSSRRDCHGCRLSVRRACAGLAAVVLTAAGLIVGGHAPPAAAWDSFGSDSHTKITEWALSALVSDTTLPVEMRSWVAAKAPLIIQYSSKTILSPLGELVHKVQRPVGEPVDLASCDPGVDLAEHPTGAARWAVGNNPGDTHPEYWWQTAVCLYRSGHQSLAAEALGQLLHSIADQGALPHAYYKTHGPLSGGENFEVLAWMTAFDTVFYRSPSSLLYPGKNVLDVDDHGDGEYATFHIPKQADWTPVLLSPRRVDAKPAYLQSTAPRRVRIDFSVAELTAAPKIEVRALYEKADGTLGSRSGTAQLTPLGWTSWTIQDTFAPNGRLWLSFARTEHGNRASTGQVQVYVTGSSSISSDAGGKPALTHPWEYYEWLREWTQWAMADPFWRRYFPRINAGGDLAFDILSVTAPNSELAILTEQWAMSALVEKWVLEDAWTAFTDPGYSLVGAVGQGYRVAFYDDQNYNSDNGVDPEETRSYSISCEPYVGQKCGSFVAPDWGDPRANVGDTIFTASGTGAKVTMKANILPAELLDRRISSVEARGATVYLYPGQNLTGQPLVVTGDTANLGDFNDSARSIRIVPDGLSLADVPTARDDQEWILDPVPVTIDVLANDDIAPPGSVTLTAQRPKHGTVAIQDGHIVYTPTLDWTAPWPGSDSFTYEVTDTTTGAADTGVVGVRIGETPPAVCPGGSDTWTGNGDNYDWFDPSNWSAGVPGQDSAVTINGNAQVAALADVTVCSLTLADAAELTSPSNNRLTVTDVTQSDDAWLIMDTDLANRYQWSGGTIAGRVTVQVNGELVIGGYGQRYLHGELHNLGMITFGELGTTTVGDVLTNDGTMRAAADTRLDGAWPIVNTATGVLKTGGHTLTLDGPALLNSGVIAVAGGTLRLEGGDHEFRAGTSIAGAGLVEVTPGADSDHETGDNLTGFGAITMDPDITLQFDGANLWGTLNPSAGTFHWTAGTVEALLTISAGVEARIDGDSPKTLTGHFVNKGALDFGGGGPVEVYNAGFTNWTTATVTGDTSLGGGGIFDNTPSGKLAVSGHTLTVDGSSLLTAGTVNLSDNATVLLKEGDHRFRTGATFAGSGTVRMADAGGTLTGTGPVTIGAKVTWQFLAGILHGKFTVTGGGLLVWSGGTTAASITVAKGSRMQLAGTSAKTLNGSLVNNGTLLWQQGPSLTVYTGQVVNTGTFTVQPAAKLLISGGETMLNRGTLALGTSAALTISTPAFTSSGILKVGMRKLTLRSGQVTLIGTSRILTRVTGRTAGTFGRVAVTQRATLAGTLDITASGTLPAVGATFKPITCGHRDGRFAHVVSHGGRTWRASYQTTSVTARAT